MDNKYGLGSTKAATEHHESHQKTSGSQITHCKFCDRTNLVVCLTMHDHRCADCGKWQHDVPQGYSTGRSSDY